ncbi:MAG TPA: alpha amylase C-terminal domain-containing protein, partial [Gammaproteobacteria bacterium]
QHSVLCYLRRAGNSNTVIALNFTPAPHDGYRIGVPAAGSYRLAFNSDSGDFGGSDLGQIPLFESEAKPWMGQPHSIVVTLPPLAGLVIEGE